MSEASSVLLKLVLLLLLGLTSVHTKKQTKTVWIVGYEKVRDKCMPVSGSAELNVLPFPFASMDDCEKGIFADNFDNTAKRWDGVVLNNGECLKVWARAKLNPFVTANFSECKKEKQHMQTTLSLVRGSSKVRRQGVHVDIDPLKAGKFVVESSITTVGMVFPPANLLMPLLNLLWPSSKTSVWDQVKDQVKAIINQKMNEAYAKHLKQFIDGLKGEIEEYNGYPDTHSHKASKLVSIDTNLGIEEPKFMDTEDPISTLTYWITFVATRSTVKTELLRIAPPNEKQVYVKQHLKMLMRYITYTGNMAYKELEKWRKSQLKCRQRGGSLFGGPDYVVRYVFTDSLDGYSTYIEYVGNHYDLSGVRVIEKEGEAWCSSQKKTRMDKLMVFIGKLRENIKAWASLFNKVATNPLVKGFSAADSKFTTDNVKCTFPFTYNGQEYTKCTTAGRGSPWCNKAGGGWGYCQGVAKMSIDLTSCTMVESSSEQYFGHMTMASDPHRQRCLPWTQQTKYNDFPMDDQSKELASNYCRGVYVRSGWPGCYVSPGVFSWCKIPLCTSSDWKRSG